MKTPESSTPNAPQARSAKAPPQRCEVCLYGNRRAGFGWIACSDSGALAKRTLLGDGELIEGRTLTECLLEAKGALRVAGVKEDAEYAIFEPGGERCAVMRFGDVTYWGAIPAERVERRAADRDQRLGHRSGGRAMTTFYVSFDGQADDHGRRSYTLTWEDKDGVFRPEPSKRDSAPVGYRRGQCFRADPEANFTRLREQGHKVLDAAQAPERLR